MRAASAWIMHSKEEIVPYALFGGQLLSAEGKDRDDALQSVDRYNLLAKVARMEETKRILELPRCLPDAKEDAELLCCSRASSLCVHFPFL